MSDNELPGAGETKTATAPSPPTEVEGSGGEGAGAGAGAGAEAATAVYVGEDKDEKVHKGNPWRSADDQTISELYAQVYESLVKSVPSAHAKKVADIVAKRSHLIGRYFQGDTKSEEGFIANLSLRLVDPRPVDLQDIWFDLKHQMTEAEEKRADALKAAPLLEAPEVKWIKLIGENHRKLAPPDSDYLETADGSLWAPFVQLLRGCMDPDKRKNRTSVSMIAGIAILRLVGHPLYALWLATRHAYRAYWEWLKDATHIMPCPGEITDDPPALPVVGGNAATAAAAVNAAVAAFAAAAFSAVTAAAPGTPTPPTPSGKAIPTGASAFPISIHETAALHSMRSTYLRAFAMLRTASELTTEVFLSRDLIDSATAGLITVGCLKYLRNENMEFHSLTRYSDVAEPKPAWYCPTVRPDLALVIDRLDIPVFLLEVKSEISGNTDRNKALVMAKLSLLRLSKLLERADVHRDLVYSFVMPVIVINGFQVEIYGCELKAPSADGHCVMEATVVKEVDMSKSESFMERAVDVNEIMFNIVCCLGCTFREGGVFSEENRKNMLSALESSDQTKPPVGSKQPEKLTVRQTASSQGPRKRARVEGGNAPASEALASLGLAVKPYWPFLLTTDEIDAEPRFFTGQYLRDGSSVFVKLLDDGDEALLETQLSAELAKSCSLFLAPSCAPLALPDRDQHAVVFPMQSGSRLHDFVQLTQQEFLSIATQLTQALSRLSECEILHGDLKPDNILYHRDGTLVVLDLGCGEDLKGGALATGFRGTHEFSAPEVCAFETEPESYPAGYGVEADTFSAGRVLEFLLERVSEPTEPRDWRRKMEKAVRSMMDSDPARRPDPADAERLFTMMDTDPPCRPKPAAGYDSELICAEKPPLLKYPST